MPVVAVVVMEGVEALPRRPATPICNHLKLGEHLRHYSL
jgi:hypothetical protein